MSESFSPSSRSFQPDPTIPRDPLADGPPASVPRAGSSFDGQGAAGLTRATREHRGLHEAEHDACDLMHRVLIASPWQRYQMDRAAARSAASEDDA